MADSIIKKLKGLFMSKNKKKEADMGNAGGTAGFEVLNDAQALDADENGGASDDLGAVEDGTPTAAPEAPAEVSSESPVRSGGILEDIEDEAPESASKAEKTHEKVTRIAAEMNTKGYGL